MKFKELAKLVSSLEGKKVQVNIAQISEVLACLRFIIASSPSALVPLVEESPKKKRRLMK